jgi:TonB family protein
MSGPIKAERLGSIQVQSTPKEWMVKLAAELRSLASKGTLPQALATETFSDSLNLRPFYGVAEQANQLHRGNGLEDIRTWNLQNRKLRTEYAAVKALILKVNEAVKEKTESLRMNVALELSALYKLILDDDLTQSAGAADARPPVEKTGDADPDEENEFMMDEAALNDDEVSGDDEISMELPGNGPPHGRSADSEFALLIKNWIDDSTLLIVAVFVHKAAAQSVQEKYFGGHPILFEDVEATLGETIRTMEDAAATFNQYLKIRDSKLRAELNKENQEGGGASVTAGEHQDHLAIDINAIRATVGRHLVDALVNEWVEFANNKASTEIRKEFEEAAAQGSETVGGEGQTCEIPITVQGSRNTRVPQPFLEETYTAIVFPNGAVLRLLEVLIHGQIVILQNIRMKQEVACRVVSYKPSTSVEGNVEVEFIQPASGFWGITFPGTSPSSRSEASASAQLATSMPPRRQAGPEIVPPSAPASRIEQVQPPPPSVKKEMPPKRTVEIIAMPAAKLPPAPPAPNVQKKAVPASPAPPVATSSMPPVPAPTPEDSIALNKAIIAAYTMPVHPSAKTAPPIRIPAHVKPAPPASPIPPAVVTVPPAGTIRPIETGKENASESAWALQTKESKLSSGRPLNWTSHLPAKRTMMFAAVGALGLAIAFAAGAYIWRSGGKAVDSQPAPSPSAATPPQAPPAGITAQPAPTATPVLNARARQKQTAFTGGGAGNAQKGNSARNSANVAARRPSTLPSHIAPPVTPLANTTDTKSGNTISPPDIVTQAPPTSADNKNAILGSIVPGNSLPAPPPASEAAPPARVFVEPRVLSTVLPAVYPSMALARGDEGVVTLTAMVNEKGKVTGTKVISGPQTLRQAAANWVTMWRFEPARLNGIPAADAVTVKVVFQKPK